MDTNQIQAAGCEEYPGKHCSASELMDESRAYDWAAQAVRGLKLSPSDGQSLLDRVASAVLESYKLGRGFHTPNPGVTGDSEAGVRCRGVVGHPPARPERNDMDKLERDTEPNNGWTIKFATLKALREQAQEMGENPTEEEVEAVALAMVNLGYALIEMPNPSLHRTAALNNQ